MAFGNDFGSLFMELRSKWMINDKDKDGMSDDFEDEHGLSKTDHSDASMDKDGDGLDNLQESILGLSPSSTDSDQDGLSDGDEIALYKTDPSIEDTDEDGLIDDEDNCPSDANADQADADEDGIGDACDVDYDDCASAIALDLVGNGDEALGQELQLGV